MNGYVLHVDVAGRRASVEFTLRQDMVEIRAGGRCVAVMVRDLLRAWLAGASTQRAALSVDDVMWFVDTAGAVTLIITGDGAWPLSRGQHRELLGCL